MITTPIERGQSNELVVMLQNSIMREPLLQLYGKAGSAKNFQSLLAQYQKEAKLPTANAKAKKSVLVAIAKALNSEVEKLGWYELQTLGSQANNCTRLYTKFAETAYELYKAKTLPVNLKYCGVKLAKINFSHQPDSMKYICRLTLSLKLELSKELSYADRLFLKSAIQTINTHVFKVGAAQDWLRQKIAETKSEQANRSVTRTSYVLSAPKKKGKKRKAKYGNVEDSFEEQFPLTTEYSQPQIEYPAEKVDLEKELTKPTAYLLQLAYNFVKHYQKKDEEEEKKKKRAEEEKKRSRGSKATEKKPQKNITKCKTK